MFQSSKELLNALFPKCNPIVAVVVWLTVIIVTSVSSSLLMNAVLNNLFILKMVQ